MIKSNYDKPIEFIKDVVPSGFEDFISAVVSGDNVDLILVDKGDNFIQQITIKNSLFNPDGVAVFPKFLFTNLKTESIVLNQNEVIRAILEQRFEQLKPMVRPYLNLISQDLAYLNNFIIHESANSYNTKLKDKNSFIVIPCKDLRDLDKDFISNFRNRMDEQQWNAFMLNNKVFPSSLGSMSETCSVVMGEKVPFRAPAFSVQSNGMTSIFPVSSNIPARWQTHLIGNSYGLVEPAQSIIQQDNVIVDGELKPKDNTQRKVVVVFHPMDHKSCRFMAGEIEVSSDVADTLVVVRKTEEHNFSVLNIAVGQTVEPNYGDFVLGTTLFGEEITLRGYKSITCVDIRTTGITGTKKVYLTGHTKAGNARIISNTGVKGVTKVRNYLGEIVFDTDVVPVELDTKELKKRYPTLDVDSLEQYKPVSKKLTVKPDMVLGMNSAKAKSNTIVLAGACLAVELGFYKPKTKHGFDGLLNSLDEKEINEAFQSLPKFEYINEFGEVVDVFVGLAYISFTELGATYSKVKPIPFPFESGRFLATDSSDSSKELYQYIWDNYLEKDKVEATKDLYQCYMSCTKGVFSNPNNLPVYNLDQIGKLFSDKDLVLTKLKEFPSESKLLDEDFNKGFFIDLSKFKGAPIIQIPSAKTFKMFSGVMKNGNIIYPMNLINASRIIRGCFKYGGNYALNTVYSKDKTRTSSALAFNAYVNTLKGVLFSSDGEAQHLVQTFIKPKILGCNLKQVAESYLPDSTVVILDKHIYNKLKKASLEGAETPVSSADIMLASVAQSTSQSELESLFNEFVKSCPMVLGIRNPSLWKTQNLALRVWDTATFELYLHIFHKKSIGEVINVSKNRDVLLTSIDILVHSHGDSDGDLYPLFVLDAKGQELLSKFEFGSVLKEELEWNNSYRLSELSSDEGLFKHHVYKLHYISNEQYKKFLLNASVAKGAIGSATLDSWVWSMMLECYRSYYQENNGVYYKGDSKVGMCYISKEDANLLGWVYTVLLQEYVVMGIKHVQNGSKDFEIYTLREIGRQANETKIRQQLKTKYNLTDDLVNKLVYVVRWAEDNNNLLKGCRNFVSLYNKGTFPYNPDALNHWEEYIVDNTYFGSLLRPLFDIKNTTEDTVATTEEDLISKLGLKL